MANPQKNKYMKYSLNVVTIAIISALTGCGGGSGGNTDVSTTAPSATSQSEAVPLAEADVAAIQIEPTFLKVNANVPEPTDVDTDGSNSSAEVEPSKIEANVVAPATATGFKVTGTVVPERNVYTAAAAANLSVFTPAQIRSAYGMSAVPSAADIAKIKVGTAEAAALGAGQTIYVVDAYSNPTVFADLNAFSTKFGLPLCSEVKVTSKTTLPLVAASGNTCQFSVVNITTAGALTDTVPAYKSGWASEIALDVQWAHAIAPLARIVLIQAPSNSMQSLTSGVQVANKAGSGVVSMSWATKEGSWVNSYETYFNNSNMTYVAATGDWGAQNNWPAVSPSVLAVGGSKLMYSGSGIKSEVAWSSSGGNVSAFVAAPSYQSSIKLTGSATATKFRAQADVSFNSDPTTGQYVAITNPTTKATGWFSYGGTSIATPQWAGIVTIANAQRVLARKAVIGKTLNASLYTKIANTSNYGKAFTDVNSGSNGSCSTCKSVAGYDTITGLGTPLVNGLLPLLTAL